MAQPSFFALRQPVFRAYFFGAATAMMADSIEHVISYWIMFEKFQSPALAGFAVLAHWVPVLLFAMWSGGLADRHDPRRIIQIGMAVFMAVSIGWGVLFLTDALEMWHAAALLVLHGLAGVLWGPAAQVYIHDLVEPKALPSAVRLSATARWLGLLMGPAVGGVILLALGPAYGILFNAALYLPFILWLWKAPYRHKHTPPTVRGFGDVFATWRAVRDNPVIASMVILVGGASFIVGNAYQAHVQMNAPTTIRGRVIGLFSMSALGLRSFSGVTVGLGGSLIGIHLSLTLAAALLLTLILLMLWKMPFGR